MKKMFDWWFPDHEQHLPEWLAKVDPPVMLHGRRIYQGHKQVEVLKHCKKRRTAIDVGAHVGLWSFTLAHEFANVKAFEPVAEHRECFYENVTATNVVLHPVALGAIKDKIKIRTTPGSSGDSWVDGPGDTEMCRLDDYGFNDVDLIKIDCEGFEENVLIGALDTLLLCRPVVIVEQKRDMATRFGLEARGAVKFLQNIRYKQVREIGGDFIMVPV